MSKEEQKLLAAIKSFYNLRIISNYRPDRLNNTKTGKNLEIDIYLYDHQVGVEYQGMIHFKHIKKYKNDPDSSRYNDSLKTELLAKKGRMCIIEIFPQDLIGDIKDNFIQRLLTTQEVCFNNLEFKKCKSLEMVYLFINKIKNKHNIKLFDKIHEVSRSRDFNNYKLNNIHKLRQFLTDINVDFFHKEREIFNVEKINSILSLNPVELRKAKLKIRYQNLPIPTNRDSNGELKPNIPNDTNSKEKISI